MIYLLQLKCSKLYLMLALSYIDNFFFGCKFNLENDGTLSIRNFVLIMTQCKNLSFESITFCTSARKLTKNKINGKFRVATKLGSTFLSG